MVVIKDVVREEGQVIVLYGRWGGGKGRWPTAGVYVSSAEHKRRAQVSSPPWPRATAAGPLNTRLNRDDTGTTDSNNRFTWYSGWMRSFLGTLGENPYGKSENSSETPTCTSSARRDKQRWRTRVFRVRARSVHLYSGKNPKQIMVHHTIWLIRMYGIRFEFITWTNSREHKRTYVLLGSKTANLLTCFLPKG